MELTAKQTREKLGIGSSRLNTLVKEGKITPSNQRNPKAKKWFMKFNSKEVSRYLSENGASRKSSNKELNIPNKGIFSRLNEIEKKIDTLIRMWS